MTRGGRRKAGDWGLEDRSIYHRGREGHGEIKWAVGSGRLNVVDVQSSEMHCWTSQQGHY